MESYISIPILCGGFLEHTQHVFWLRNKKYIFNHTQARVKTQQMSRRSLRRLMTENDLPPHPLREFRRHILSCKEFQAASFQRCLQSVRRGVSLWQLVIYVTISNLEK